MQNIIYNFFLLIWGDLQCEHILMFILHNFIFLYKGICPVKKKSLPLNFTLNSISCYFFN